MIFEDLFAVISDDDEVEEEEVPHDPGLAHIALSVYTDFRQGAEATEYAQGLIVNCTQMLRGKLSRTRRDEVYGQRRLAEILYKFALDEGVRIQQRLKTILARLKAEDPHNSALSMFAECIRPEVGQFETPPPSPL